MAEALTFTSGAFMQCTSSTASRTGGTIFDILTATSSVDRRVYGLSLVSTDNAANPVRIWLNNGTDNIQVANVNVVANSGNATTTALTDVFSSTVAEAVLAKTRDNTGVTYFNLPAGWSIRMSLTNTPGAAETMYSFVFGENY